VISRRTAVGVLVIVVVGGGLFLRHYFSPVEVVKRKLHATIDAFEEERLLAVMSGISRGYSDRLGLSYETLGGYLHETMDTYEDLRVDLELGKPVVAESEIRIDIQFVLWGRYEGARGYVLGSLSDPCTATLLWRKETPGWRLASTLELDIPELRHEIETRRKELGIRN
jgi:hypothetical protein